MNPVNPPSGLNRARFVLVLALLIALFVVTGCGKSKDDPKEPSNKWDEMKWDESKWGGIVTSPDSILIS